VPNKDQSINQSINQSHGEVALYLFHHFIKAKIPLSRYFGIFYSFGGMLTFYQGP